MADERIDVEVTDKVSGSVEKKLTAIGKAAGNAHTFVERLKAELSSINTSGLLKLESASNSASRAITAQMNATARLTSANAKAALANSQAAVQAQKLATETARTAAAQSRAEAAAASAQAATTRLATAQNAAKMAAASFATEEELAAAAIAKAKAQFDAGEISIRKYVAAMQLANASNKGGGAGTVGGTQGGVNNEQVNNMKRLADAGKQARGVNANIIAQLQDIGVSLAGGQNPFLVLIQQGSQLSYIATTLDGGFKALAATIVRLVAPFALLGGIAAGLYLGFKNFTSDIAAESKPQLEAYAKSLGLTSKEMRKLQDETVGANGKLKEMDVITITSADSWSAFWRTVSQGLSALTESFGVLNDYFRTAWKYTTDFLYAAFIGFYASVQTLISTVFKLVVNVAKVAVNTIMVVANSVIMVIQDVINAAISGWNGLLSVANGISEKLGFGKLADEVGKVDLGIKSVTDNTLALSEIHPVDEFIKNVKEGDATIKTFGATWKKNAQDIAKTRIKGLADAIKDNRNPAKGKVDHTEENRALALKKVNAELDNELNRMKMLKDERAQQQRFDQISEQLLGKKIKLNDTETASIKAKIASIEAYKYVQAESDRIQEEAIGPARTMNATIDAATQLYDRKAITLEKYNEQLQLATRNYDEATDPLFALNEQIDSAMRLTGLYGDALERGNMLEQIRQQYAQKGQSIYDTSTGKLKEEVQAILQKNAALTQQQYIQSQVGAIVNPILDRSKDLENESAYYAELKRLRDNDTLNQEQYRQANAALDSKFREMRLQGWSDMFGGLASLSKSGNKKIAAIGKAAAVAQATINTYLAVSEALKQPFPLNILAASVAAIQGGIQVAGIVSTNVGNFATGGQFMVGGKGGIDQNNVAMNLTRGERVTVETAQQQRANDNGSGGGDSVNNTKVVNLFDERSFIGAMDSEDGEQVVMNIIRRRSSDTRDILGVNGR